MATTSDDSNNVPVPPTDTIIEFFPRRRLRQCINEILTLLSSDDDESVSVARRLVADANALHSDVEIVSEIERAIERDPAKISSAIIALRIIATEPARAILWQIGRNRDLTPLWRLDALRSLSQLGERIEMREMILLANACEEPRRPRGKDQ